MQVQRVTAKPVVFESTYKDVPVFGIGAEVDGVIIKTLWRIVDGETVWTNRLGFGWSTAIKEEAEKVLKDCF